MRTKTLSLLSATVAACMSMSCSSKVASETVTTDIDSDSVPVVYYIREITPENIVRIYEALGRPANGDNVAVKISTGESTKSNQLNPTLIEPFVKAVNGTIVECNTAYGGNRSTTEDHLKAAREHGYTAIANVDIMDSAGDTILPVDSARHIPYAIVGKNLLNYDFLVVLSHFKGHAMGGFGGALKNVSIGISSADGKAWVHTAGKVKDPAKLWENLPEQDDFIESMAEACQAIFNHFGDNKLFINVANRLSVDCDCNGNPAEPQMADFGILASIDPVALDRACVDMVYNSTDSGKVHLIERIESRHGAHILEYGEQIGLGSQKYRLVELK